MKALILEAHGAPEVLRLGERPEPTAGPGQLRIAVRAAGVNFADIMARQGLYAPAPKPPSVLGYEVAGTVESVGAGVTRFRAGDRVIAGTRFGGFAELVVAGEADLFALPASLSFEEGAAVPVAYGTAYAALARLANLQRGDAVLIHAVAGSVGIAATQLARHLGARVFGTASKSKHAAVLAHGVERAIDYHTEHVPTAVREMTEGRGLDVILDSRGGRDFRESYELLRPGGRLVLYGASSLVTGERRSLLAVARMLLGMPRFGAIALMQQNRAVMGLNLLSLWDDRGSFEEIARPLTTLLAEGVVRPVVSRAFPVAEAPAAHRFVQERRNVGKVVLTFD